MLERLKKPPSEDTPTFAGLIRLIQYICICADARNDATVAIAAAELCGYLRGGGSIIKARVRDGASVLPDVGVRFKYAPRVNPAVTQDRLFDVLFFAAMLMMDWGGGRFRFHPTREGGKLYLNIRYEHPSRKTGGFRVYFARVILNTPDDRATPFEDDHHSYRYDDLNQRSPDKRLPKPELGRAHAVKIACDLYKARYLPAVDTVAPEEFAALLTEVFTVATAFHGGTAEV